MLAQTQTKEKKRSLTRRAAYIGVPVGLTAVLSIGCVEGPLGLLLQLLLVFLGASPAGSFADPNSQEFGQVEFAMVPMTATGQHAEDAEEGATDDIEYDVVCDEPEGTKVDVEGVETAPVEEVGTFTILLDGSGSMERSFSASVCEGCPYDLKRSRVEAAQQLTKRILEKAPESRIGIFEFTAGTDDAPPAELDCDLNPASSGFKKTRELQGYTENNDALVDAANKADSCGGTPLYDSLNEVLDSMNSDIQANFQTKPITKALIVITDGEDTLSTSADLSAVIAKAKSLDIPVHVVGLGEASELDATYNRDLSDLVKDLRQLANDTGGYYAAASSSDDLVQLAETIATGLTGGFENASVRLDPVPPSGTLVKGRIRAKLSDGTFGPYSNWSFVAP